MEELLEKWEIIINQLKDEYEIKDVPFETWIRPLKIHKVNGSSLFIIYSNDESDQMTIDYITKRYKNPLMVTIAEYTNKEYNITFLSKKEAETLSDPPSHDVIAARNQATIINNPTLNPKYTFDTFVVGSNNRFAQTASLAVAEAPGERYNPLYIYGGPGLGKTHLMHSIGNYILEENPKKNVLYVTSEEFTNEVINSLRDGGGNNTTSAMNKFRDKYRTVDVLMIDDIQFIIGKERTQEEFFHTFNALHTAGKQIILTSDKPPKDMDTLENRIRSRFEWGLMADIGNPDYETRMAIIRKKLESENIEISNDIITYIATHIKSNVREIEGALNRILALTNIEGRTLTLDDAQKELQNIISPDNPKDITPQLIMEVVADHFNISMDQMISTKRTAPLVAPRQIAMYLCSEMTSYTTTNIGTIMGRNHSTVLHGINKVEEQMSYDEDYRNQIALIKKKINPSL